MGKYEAILKIAELGNITKAADELGYTQANVSHIIHRMEEEFQVLLFNRQRRGVTPTKIGGNMIKVMQQIEDLENELYLIAMADRQRVLRVASIYSVSSTILPGILTEFYKKYPDAVVTIPEYGTWMETENAVKTNEVDLAFYGGTYYSGYEFISLGTEPYYAIVSARHPLADRTQISAEDMRQYNVILPSEGISNAVLRELVREMHISPHLVPRLESDRGTVALVEADLGISILPRLALRNIHRKIRCIPLEEKPTREVDFLCRSYYELPEVAKDFIKLSRRAFQALDEEENLS